MLDELDERFRPFFRLLEHECLRIGFGDEMEGAHRMNVTHRWVLVGQFNRGDANGPNVSYGCDAKRYNEQ